MCTIGRISSRTAGKAHHRADQTGNPTWCEQNRTDYGSKRSCNSFLNTAMIPVAQSSLMIEDYDGKTYNVITRENYEFLRDSYFQYVKLLKKEAKHIPGNSIGEGIANLYDEMSELLGEDLNVNIEREDDRLFFRLWKYHNWGECTLYYFPVKFLESLNPTLRKIAITFIHKLMKANGIDTFMDYEDTDYMFEMLVDDAGSDDDLQDRKKRLRLLNSYQSGKIGKLLKRVESKSYYKNLPNAIKSYSPQNGFEIQLIEVMKKGLRFLTPEQGIMQYAYDAYYEENPDFQPMYLQQQIRVIYDTNDIVTDQLVDYYNLYSRETYDITPVTICDLSPNTKELFRMDDYPEQFFKWADEFIGLIC